MNATCPTPGADHTAHATRLWWLTYRLPRFIHTRLGIRRCNGGNR